MLYRKLNTCLGMNELDIITFWTRDKCMLEVTHEQHNMLSKGNKDKFVTTNKLVHFSLLTRLPFRPKIETDSIYYSYTINL